MKKKGFSTVSHGGSGFTLFSWIKKSKEKAKTIKESENAESHQISGFKGLLDCFIALGVAFLSKLAVDLMNRDISNPFLILFGLFTIMLSVVIPLVFMARAIMNSSTQVHVNKKAIGYIALVFSILTVFGCIFLWAWGFIFAQ